MKHPLIVDTFAVASGAQIRSVAPMSEPVRSEVTTVILRYVFKCTLHETTTTEDINNTLAHKDVSHNESGIDDDDTNLTHIFHLAYKSHYVHHPKAARDQQVHRAPQLLGDDSQPW